MISVYQHLMNHATEEEIVFPYFYLTLKMNIKSDILHIQYTKYILCKAINTSVQ